MTATATFATIYLLQSSNYKTTIAFRMELAIWPLGHSEGNLGMPKFNHGIVRVGFSHFKRCV